MGTIRAPTRLKVEGFYDADLENYGALTTRTLPARPGNSPTEINSIDASRCDVKFF